MTITQTAQDPSPPLRLWPGVAAVTLLWILRFVLPVFVPDLAPIGAMAGPLFWLIIVVWWIFFSRASRVERFGGVLLLIVAVFAMRPLLHESMATGAMGLLYYFYVIPVLSLAFVLWAALSRYLPQRQRWVALIVAVALSCGAWTLVRTGGFTSNLDNDFAWRWSATPEDRLLARADDAPRATGSVPAETGDELIGEMPAEWPGFRGADRDARIRGLRIETDWSTSPPRELWRRSIGPGWSSFAVRGDLLYTQEQRGEDEVVACYRASTGEPVWKHSDPARFWESNGGPGPRGTPTFHDGTLYTLGGTGILNALSADDGAVVWSRDAGADTGAEVPMWGFSGSPLVVDDLVIVAASGRLIAYDRATGEPRWTGPSRSGGYSSPQRMTIGGVPQILHVNGAGLISVDFADGSVLWEHPWPGDPIVQPAQTAEGDLLISVGPTGGTLRLHASAGTEGWSVEERWVSKGLRSYSSDFVVHEGHAYGFDGSTLVCIDLADGSRKWAGARYGLGQLLLLVDQDVLLVVSEAGELALVRAVPDGYTELGRIPAVAGKTWGHPVLVEDLLVVRNAEEIAAFRLSLAGD